MLTRKRVGWPTTGLYKALTGVNNTLQINLLAKRLYRDRYTQSPVRRSGNETRTRADNASR